MNSLFQKEKIYRNGSFSISSTVCPCTTKPPSSPFRFDNAVGKMLLGQCCFSSGEMTGKFRKVASHSAPEPAFGLFLNLPWGICPLEPRHVNGVSIPAKCPLDISTEHLLIDQGFTLHPPKGRCPLWNPVVNLSVRMICLLIKNKNQAKKGDESL